MLTYSELCLSKGGGKSLGVMMFELEEQKCVWKDGLRMNRVSEVLWEGRS